MVFAADNKALQHGKIAICRFEKFFEPANRAFKGDPAHAIALFKCGTHATQGTASHFLIDALIFDENQ
jgi:hypothetical protein